MRIAPHTTMDLPVGVLCLGANWCLQSGVLCPSPVYRYANSFTEHWVDTAALSPKARQLGHGGHVGTRNYELDSGCYFIRLLYHLYQAHGLDPATCELAAKKISCRKTHEMHMCPTPASQCHVCACAHALVSEPKSAASTTSARTVHLTLAHTHV